MREIKAQFSSNGTKVLLRKQIEADMQTLRSRVENFIRHLADFMRGTARAGATDPVAP